MRKFAALLMLASALVLSCHDADPAAEPSLPNVTSGHADETGSARTEFTVSSNLGTFTATLTIEGSGTAAPDDAVLRAVAREFARRVGLSTDKPTTPTLTHAQAVVDLERAADEMPDDLSHPPWLAAALAVFPVHLQPAFYAIGCAESDLNAVAVGPPNHNGTRDYGWLQINSKWFDGTAYPSVAAFAAAAKTDPVQSAVGALQIYGLQGLEAWSTWRGSTQATLALARAHGGSCN